MNTVFITKELLDNQSADMWNTILTKVAGAAVEEALRLLPQVTAQLIKTSVSMDSMMADFLDRNKDFVGNEGVVRKVIMDTEAANPGASYPDILEKATPVIKGIIKSANRQTGKISLNFDSIAEGK